MKAEDFTKKKKKKLDKSPSYNRSSIMPNSQLVFYLFMLSVFISIPPVLLLSAASCLAVFESLSVHMQDGLTYKAELARGLDHHGSLLPQ